MGFREVDLGAVAGPLELLGPAGLARPVGPDANSFMDVQDREALKVALVGKLIKLPKPGKMPMISERMFYLGLPMGVRGLPDQNVNGGDGDEGDGDVRWDRPWPRRFGENGYGRHVPRGGKLFDVEERDMISRAVGGIDGYGRSRAFLCNVKERRRFVDHGLVRGDRLRDLFRAMEVVARQARARHEDKKEEEERKRKRK